MYNVSRSNYTTIQTIIIFSISHQLNMIPKIKSVLEKSSNFAKFIFKENFIQKSYTSLRHVIQKLRIWSFWKYKFWVPSWYPDFPNLAQTVTTKQQIWTYKLSSSEIIAMLGTIMVPKTCIFQKFNISAFICRIWCLCNLFRSNFKSFWNPTFLPKFLNFAWICDNFSHYNEKTR